MRFVALGVLLLLAGCDVNKEWACRRLHAIEQCRATERCMLTAEDAVYELRWRPRYSREYCAQTVGGKP